MPKMKRTKTFTLCLTLIAVFAMVAGGRSDSAVETARTPLPMAALAPCSANMNLLKNPGFEDTGPNGPSTSWPAQSSTNAAAASWTIHSDNNSAPLKTRLEPSTKQPGGKMLHVIAGGNEGGVYQILPQGLNKIAASAWVYVKRGHVVMQANAGSSGPFAKSATMGKWELLQITTDGSTPVDWFVIYNQDPQGGEFFTDAAKVTCGPSGPTGQKKPDLIVRISGPQAAKAGDDIGPLVKVTARNIGSMAAPGTTGAISPPNGYMIDVVLSKDTNVPAAFATFSPNFVEDALLKGGRISVTKDLAPLALQAYPTGAGIPADTPTGLYNLCARIDAGNKVAESNEANNVHCASIKIKGTP